MVPVPEYDIIAGESILLFITVPEFDDILRDAIFLSNIVPEFDDLTGDGILLFNSNIGLWVCLMPQFCSGFWLSLLCRKCGLVKFIGVMYIGKVWDMGMFLLFELWLVTGAHFLVLFFFFFWYARK